MMPKMNGFELLQAVRSNPETKLIPFILLTARDKDEDIVKGLLIEAQTNGEGSTQSARVAAWKALTDYTGGFDNNTQKWQ